MTVRERNFLIVLFVGVAALMGVGILGYQWFVAPVREANRAIAELEDEVWQKQLLLRAVEHDRKKLAKYKALSLPNNPDQAQSDYFEYLQMLLRDSGLSVHVQGPPAGSLKAPAPQGKKAGHVPLAFTVSALGDMSGVIKALAALRAAPIAHRIKSLTLAPADATGSNAGKLKIQMGIEALIVHKADSLQPHLTAPGFNLVMLENLTAYLRAPGGMAIGPWAVARVSLKKLVEKEEMLARNYSEIPNRNIFTGPMPPSPKDPDPFDDLDVLAHIYLDQASPTLNEAFLRNSVYRAPEIKLRPKSGGYQIFQITNEERDLVLLRGKALRVDQRDLYFQVGEDIYGLHFGQSLKQALRRPLSTDELEELQLTSLYDENFAQEGTAPAKKKGGSPRGFKKK